MIRQTATLATQSRPPHRQFSLAAVLAGGLALLLLLLAGLTAWQINTAGEKELRLREAQMLGDAARTTASQLAVALDERRADLVTLRDLLEHDFAQADAAPRRALLGRTLASHRHFSWMGVTDTAGQIVLSAPVHLEGLSVQGHGWFESARRGQDFYGDLHTARAPEPDLPVRLIGGHPARVFDIALPLRAAAPGGDPARPEVVGVLGSHLDEGLMADVLGQALGARDGQHLLAAAVVDTQGNILYDSQGQLGSVRQLPLALATPGPGGLGDIGRMGEAVWPGNRDESYYVSARVPSTEVPGADQLHWRVVVRSDAARLHASVSELHLRVAAVCLLAGLLFAMIGALLLRGTTRSLQALVDDMRRFAITGEPPAERAPGRIAEVDRLHGSLLAMTHHVALQRRALADSQRQMVQALARAGEYRDNDTGQHVLRMSHCAGHLATLAGLDQATVEQIRLAAQLHDLGKIGIPDAVLLKRGRIDEAERAIVRRHPEIGAGILAGFDAPLLALARTVAYTHHERWDGGGYPRGLAGEAIPLAGRIVSLCDVFDALLSSRAYKPGWPLARVIEWLNDQAGSHFDPHLTDLLLAHVQEFVQIRADIDAQAPPAYDTGIGPFDGDCDGDEKAGRRTPAGRADTVGGELAA
ncbi:MAG: hypothetical protein RLZZ584_2699 [Pseudomonadota bacterium]